MDCIFNLLLTGGGCNPSPDGAAPESSGRRCVMPSKPPLPTGLQLNQVIPRQPQFGSGLDSGTIFQYLGQVMKRIYMVKFTGVDNTQITITDPGTMYGFKE